jgi:predicted extracellular nuclease
VTDARHALRISHPLRLAIAALLTTAVAGAQAACPVTTQISSVQGSGDSTPLFAQTVTVEGVVVGGYQQSTQLRGFFLQEETWDEDGVAETSEGVFVFSGSTPALTVAEGQRVCVTGMASESLGMTRIDATRTGGSLSLTTPGDNLADVTTASIDLPVVGTAALAFERYEGMRVSFADRLVVTEHVDLDRFGAIRLTADARPTGYTQSDETPTMAEYAAYLDALARHTVLLDDDDDTQYSALPAGVLAHPQTAGFGVGEQGINYFRAGDSVTGLTGVMSWTNGGATGANAWRLRPVASAPAVFAVDNPRVPAQSAALGDLRVVGFNVGNYFSTIDTTGGPTAPLGADSAAEFERQSAKLVATLTELDADVIGVVGIENNAGFAVQELANRLNAATGSADYDVVFTGQLGTDAVAVGLIYRTTAVAPVGAPAVLADVAFTTPNGGTEPRNHPAVAQTFSAAGEKFTIVVNHFAARSSTGATGWDLDQLDGQGAFNDTRTKGAAYLANAWLASDPTGQGDEDYLLIGDLNAFRGEAPVAQLRGAGFDDLVALYQGADAYSVVMDGQAGYADHAFASAAMLEQVVGAYIWHINADEVEAFDYNDTTQDAFGEQFAERKPSGNELYAADAFRSATRDPVVVDIALTAPPPPPPPPPTVIRGDVDGDGDIDLDDIKVIQREKHGAAGSDDPRDVDGDGYITVDDAKLAREICTRAQCSTQGSEPAGQAQGLGKKER